MKIAVNTGNYEILNSIIREAKQQDNTIAIAKFERALFEHIGEEDVEAYVISNGTTYAQKAVDFIKKYCQYTPVIVIGKSDEYNIKNADIVFPFNSEIDTEVYAKSILNAIYSYYKNFETVKKLTAKLGEEIKFANAKYDPTRRILYCGDKSKKLSPKQGSIFELLASNFQKIVKKELILEKVWQDSNYFVGRSLDVFVSHLRRILEECETGTTITNVNIGLVLDYEDLKSK